MTAWHLAQVNVATLAAPLDSPRLASFVERLEPVNALADRSPGFVWRLQGDGGDATSIHVFDDDRFIVNLTVWESLEALRDYVFSSDHADVLRRRREWFEPMIESHLAMWWVPAGTIPTVADAEARLETLRRVGPSPDAFTFRQPFPAPSHDEMPAAR
jgi:heme-degrading monooxygenase HmoA